MIRMAVPALLGLLFFLGACGGDRAQQLAKLDELIRLSDSTRFELEEIDTLQVKSMCLRVDSLRQALKELPHIDTLSLDFARKLDAFLEAGKMMETLSNEVRECHRANEQAGKRLKLLRSDIETGAGERGRYAEYLSGETAEARKLRSECRAMSNGYSQAKSAVGQYGQEVERFIYRTVQ